MLQFEATQKGEEEWWCQTLCNAEDLELTTWKHGSTIMGESTNKQINSHHH